MARFLGYLLLLSVLFAQSAWAFEGQPGQFHAGNHSEQPAHAPAADDGEGVGHHCVHSPVHFFAVHRDPVVVHGAAGRAPLPAYHASPASHALEPPIQPPRG